MAKYASQQFLDGGFTAFKANVNKMILLKAYTIGDSFTTVNTTNNICQVTVSSPDFTLSGADTAARVMTTATKSATASASGTSNSIAFVDTVNSVVYWVTSETSAQSVTSGNTVNFPSLTYTSNQPT